MAYPMAHPMAYRWSILLKHGSALLQTCVNYVLRQSVISTTLFRPLGGVSLKFSKQTLGRLESGKPECRINTIFGELSHERGILLQSTPREFQLTEACSFRADSRIPVSVTSLNPCLLPMTEEFSDARYVKL